MFFSLFCSFIALPWKLWYVCLRYKWNISSDSWMFPVWQPRNQTLCDITEIFFFSPLVKWPSGEIVIVSCTFLFWSSCHFLIQLIEGCVFCQGKYIDTSLLLTAEEGHKNFIKGSFCFTSFCLAKKCMLQNNFMYRTNPIDLKETTYMVSVL